MKPYPVILLITNKGDITTDFIVKNLSASNENFFRLNTDEIGKSLQLTFDFFNKQFILFDKYHGREIDLLTIKAIYFRRPELPQQSENLTAGERNFVNSEIAYSLEGLYRILGKAFWLNNVYSIRVAENKIYQLLIAERFGLHTPRSMVTNNPAHALSFYNNCHQLCIVKPIKSGLVEGLEEEAVIFTNKLALDAQNAERIAPCPVYMQELKNKKADVRITLVGKEIFPALIHSQQNPESQVDWRRSSTALNHSQLDVPEDVKDKCIQLATYFNLNFAALDFILDEEGNYIFLEINPNGQWAWIETQLNLPISNAICKILIEESNK